MSQVIHVQSAGSDIGSNQQLNVFNTELLHHIVALRLAQFAMQRIGVVTVLYQFVGNFLCFLTGTAKNDTVDVRIEVGNTLQCQVFILCTNHIVDILDVLVSFVFVPDNDFFRVLHVLLHDAGNTLRHCSGEK